MDKIQGTPTPFPIDNPARRLRDKLLEHLDLLRMPVLRLHGVGVCSQQCHIIEHNHTIDAIKHFLDNVQI